MLSCVVRFFNAGTAITVFGAAGTAEAAGCAGEGAVSRVLLSGAGANLRRVVSTTPAAVCGVDAVDTGGAPLLTDSGPQPTKTAKHVSAEARRNVLRDVERSIVLGDLYDHGERDARQSTRFVAGR